ncbi:MAG: hypothetical protein U1A27_14465 [Phycisphaerae bacterium]
MPPPLHILDCPAPEPGGSLVASLRGLLGWCQRPVAADELIAVSGVAALLPAAVHEPDPAAWPAYARDAFLVDAALHYGLVLRDLHPPDAAPLPAPPREFEWHFRDSYLPLIRAALAHQQPTLAWMGWPAPHARDWGVIIACDSSGTCLGRLPGRGGDAVPLERAAVQCYVLTDAAGPLAPPGDRLHAALRRAADVLNNRLPARCGALTGPAAIERWRERLSGVAADDARAVLAVALRGATQARQLAAEWLARHAAVEAGAALAATVVAMKALWATLTSAGAPPAAVRGDDLAALFDRWLALERAAGETIA